MCPCKGNCNNNCKHPAAEAFKVGDVWEDINYNQWTILSTCAAPPRTLVAQRYHDKEIQLFHPDGRVYPPGSMNALDLRKKRAALKTIERWLVVDKNGRSWTKASKPEAYACYFRNDNIFGIKHIIFEVTEGEGLDVSKKTGC